jgi:hypothetical protein
MHTPPTSASVQITIEGDLFADLENGDGAKSTCCRALLQSGNCWRARLLPSAAGLAPLDAARSIGLRSKRRDSRP